MHIIDEINLGQLEFERIAKMARFVGKYDEVKLQMYREVALEQQRAVVGKPYYRAYLNIVKNTARFIKENGAVDPMKASIIFEYLLWNGYLSKDKKLVYSVSGRINNNAISGADIMRGKSVCVNNAEMLTRVLKEMGFEANLTGCTTTPNIEGKREYMPSIERSIIKRPLDAFVQRVTYPLGKALGNHAVSLIKTEEGYYISDPTRMAFAYMSDFLKAQYIGINTDMKIRVNGSLASGVNDDNQYIKALMQSGLELDRRPISLEKIKDLYESTVELLDSRKPLLDDFHESNKEDIATVCKTLAR